LITEPPAAPALLLLATETGVVRLGALPVLLVVMTMLPRVL
jgi:hypothetical protein